MPMLINQCILYILKVDFTSLLYQTITSELPSKAAYKIKLHKLKGFNNLE